MLIDWLFDYADYNSYDNKENYVTPIARQANVVVSPIIKQPLSLIDVLLGFIIEKFNLTIRP